MVYFIWIILALIILIMQILQVDLDVHSWLAHHKYNDSLIMAIIQIMHITLSGPAVKPWGICSLTWLLPCYLWTEILQVYLNVHSWLAHHKYNDSMIVAVIQIIQYILPCFRDFFFIDMVIAVHFNGDISC